MQFLKILSWVLLGAIIALFGWANRTDVRVNLWADLVWDTRLWFVILIAFLLGWLPTWLIHRARLWTLNRRLDAFERQRAAPVPAEAPPPAPADTGEPVL